MKVYYGFVFFCIDYFFEVYLLKFSVLWMFIMCLEDVCSLVLILVVFFCGVMVHGTFF